jgi:hypothetical protein
MKVETVLNPFKFRILQLNNSILVDDTVEIIMILPYPFQVS